MNRLDSCVLNFLRDLERLVDRDLGRHLGRPPQLEDGLAEDVAVDHRHALELPVLRVAADQLVDLGLVALRPPHERLCEFPRLGIHRMPQPEVVEVRLGLALALDVHLVEELERELPGLAAAAHQSPPARACRPPARGRTAQPARHLERGERRFLAAVAHPPPARSHACSSVSAVITPKVDGHPGVERDAADAVGGHRAHVVEVRGAALDHHAHAHHAREAPGARERLRGLRQLEGARYPVHLHRVAAHRVIGERGEGAVEQLLGDGLIEAGHHHREAV